jgi:hypothetical protein
MTRLRARALVNLVLLSLVLGLVLFIWLDPWRGPPPLRERLSAIDPSQIRKLRVEGSKRSPIELTRGNSGWRLVAPLSLPANEYRVAALLGLASATVHDTFHAQGKDLTEFGLQPPKAKVLLAEHEFRFGDTEPLNGWRYVGYGPNVHLITDHYFHHLLATAPAFVDPAPIGEDARPAGFSISGVKLWLENGRWRINPPKGSSSGDDGERLANAWSSARASSVKGFDSGLNWEQTVLVELEGEDEPLAFRVARLEYELVLGRPEWKVQYHFPKKAGLRLLLPAN